MDGFRFTVVKRLCEPFCPPHHPITQICTLKLVPMGEHKASPLLCGGFASRGVHGGKGTSLSLHPDISLYVSFTNKVYGVVVGVGHVEFAFGCC